MEITRDNIGRYEFEWRQYASLDRVTTDSNVTRRGNDVYLSNLRAGDDIMVYTIDGRMVMHTRADGSGDACVSLDRLGRGIYLLTVNNFTTKIIKQ